MRFGFYHIIFLPVSGSLWITDTRDGEGFELPADKVSAWMEKIWKAEF